MKVPPKTEEKPRFSVGDLPAPSFCLSPDGRLVAANKGFCNLVGYSAAELGEMTLAQLMQSGCSRPEWGASSLSAELKTASADERVLKRRDGSSLLLSLQSSLIRGEDGQPQYTLVTAQDLSYRKQIERRLKESENRFKTLYEHAPFSAQLLDMRGQTLRVNAAWVDLWQITGDDLVTKVLGPYSVLADAQLEALGINEHIQSAFAGKSAATPAIYYDPTISGIQGRPRWVVAYVHPIRDGLGKVCQVLLIHHDMTDYIRTEEDLKKAKIAAEVSNRLKSAFLANMSHEIRTPLTAILGFNELLKTLDLPEQIRFEYHETIKKNGSALAHLIDDILEFSAIESGSVSVEKANVDLRALTAEVVELIRPEATKKNISIDVKVERSVPSTVMSDPVKLRQILLNLVGNAIKFTATGDVSIVLSVPASAHQFTVAIKDTGIGISKEDRSKLFEPFSQVDYSNTRSYGGTGLGLALSRKMAQALGGDIALLDSLPGRGSTFILTHPLSKAASDDEVPRLSRRRIDLSGVTQSLAGTTILVVDDSADNRFLVAEVLKTYGATVETATNGLEGMEKALGTASDLVLMDVQMPNMDGIEATKELRRRGFDKPIIALTARVLREDEEKCYAAGFNAYAPKPIDFSSLIEMIRSYFIVATAEHGRP